MSDLKGIDNEPGRTGLRVRHLTFRKHEIAEWSENRLVARPFKKACRQLSEALSAREATVRFENGWGVSLATCRPRQNYCQPVIAGDDRIPTFEVEVFDADDRIVERHKDVEVDDVEALFAIIASR